MDIFVKKSFILFLFALTLQSCTSLVRFTSEGNFTNEKIGRNNEKVNTYDGFSDKLYGKASYYAEKFEYRKTANGEIYSGSKLTAAHRELPFGTMLKVTNLKNLKQVIVRVNDRGPFVSGRILDLSRAAAEELDMIRDGIAEVEIEIIK